MKGKQKYILLVLGAAVVLTGLFLVSRNSVSTPETGETREINVLLAQADIEKVNSWAVSPNCGETGSRENGYLLQVNNLAVSQVQESELKNVAVNQGYAVKERDDGYVIEHDTWEIIVLNEDRADLFISIHYSQRPTEFPEGGNVCS